MFVIPTSGISVYFIFVLFHCTEIEELRVDIKSHHGIKSNSSYLCIKYDYLLPFKIQRSLVPNSSVIEPNAFSFITVWKLWLR